ncbi:MAG: hypothetical protein LBJ10_03030 [Clostridiales bacterium]|jgi:hypothetical protein|nr:hypothetical protein [Clostridiales bacterium]
MARDDIWYADTFSSYRSKDAAFGNVTEQGRVMVISGARGLIYSPSKPDLRARSPDMADYSLSDKLACGLAHDIRPGDELEVTRGGAAGRGGAPERYFAGAVVKYYEPFGGARPRLAHQEIALSATARPKGAI